MAEKTNLLFIYTDEQRYDTLRAYGNSLVEMPNLDRLARESLVFERAYVTQPVCTPSRSSLLTGLYPHSSGCTQNNIPLAPEIPCLPEMIEDGGYRTAHFGKWHLGDEVFAQHGFSEWRSTEDSYRRYYREGRDGSARSSYHDFLLAEGFRPAGGETFSRGECARLPEEYGKPAYLAGEASSFIRKNKDNPFILYLNFLEPHMPFFGPRDGQYDPANIPLPPNFGEPPGPRNPLKTRLFRRLYFERGQNGIDLKSESGWRRLIANYYGLCSLVDTHAGAVIETLEECGLGENTIIVFTSDHGDMMGSHQLLAKGVMYEEAVRVPLMIRLPGGKKKGVIRGPVSHVDVVPTLLDLMDRPVPGGLHGKSRRGALEGGCPGEADDVFIEWNGNDGFSGKKPEFSALPRELPGWAEEMGTREELEKSLSDPVRTIVAAEGWKLNKSACGEDELYNLHDDPLETRNLAGEADYRDLEQDLGERIENWREKTGDK